ncbi:MAG TPA: copper resistance protein CopC, partial [Actinomycetota bacterium]|nr:copper resistance protein CopC [Actinomycetota bacterium]
SQITAEFTEPLTDSSSMSVFDPCGSQVDHGDSNPNGYNMSVSMSGDKAGTYTVQFKAQSALDAHVTSGSFTFTSSGGDPCPGSEPPPDPGGGGSGGGGGGGSGGGGSGEGGSGGGRGGGTPQDPAAPAAPGGSETAGSGGGGAGRGNGGGSATGTPRARSNPRSTGGGRQAPVAIQNTGSTAPAEQPAPWDLPLSGVAMAFALCVMIGAAGGRVYAGIVAPPRH